VIKLEADGAHLPVALLSHDDFGLVAQMGDLLAPSRVFVDILDGRLALVVLASVDKHHDIGILLDGAGFP
jgi:hypothetical protein